MKEHKGQQISKKGTLELQKDEKKAAGYPCPNVFFELSRPNEVFTFFESGDT